MFLKIIWHYVIVLLLLIGGAFYNFTNYSQNSEEKKYVESDLENTKNQISSLQSQVSKLKKEKEFVMKHINSKSYKKPISNYKELFLKNEQIKTFNNYNQNNCNFQTGNKKGIIPGLIYYPLKSNCSFTKIEEVIKFDNFVKKILPLKLTKISFKGNINIEYEILATDFKISNNNSKAKTQKRRRHTRRLR